MFDITLVGLKWSGTLLAIGGATLVASNVGLSGVGFVGLFLSSLAWIAAGVMMRELSIVLLNAAFLVINFVGAARWL